MADPAAHTTRESTSDGSDADHHRHRVQGRVSNAFRLRRNFPENHRRHTDRVSPHPLVPAADHSRGVTTRGFSKSEKPTRFIISLRTRSMTPKATEAPSSLGSM